MEAAITSICYELEETIETWVKYVLASVDQWTRPPQGTWREGGRNTAGVTNVPRYTDPKPLPVDNWRKEEVPRRVPLQDRNHMAQVQDTATEVTGDFVQGLDLTWPKFEMQLKEVKAWASHMAGMLSTTEPRADCRCCRRTGTGAGTAQPPKFNGSTSRAMFQWQLNMVVEHNDWMLCDSHIPDRHLE